MELLKEHTHTLSFTHTHFPGLSFISQCVYVCVHVAWQRKTSLFHCPLRLSGFTEQKAQREWPQSLFPQSCMDSLCVCVCVYTHSPLMLKHIVHAVLISDPSLLTMLTLTASSPGADGTRICVCVHACLFVCECVFEHSEETVDPWVVGPRQA